MNLFFWRKVGPDHLSAYFRKPTILTEAEQKRANMDRLMVLGSATAETPWWKTMLSYADEHAGNEHQAALQPDLSDAVRHYNAGRAAAALDFALALRDLHAEALALAKKMEKGEK